MSVVTVATYISNNESLVIDNRIMKLKRVREIIDVSNPNTRMRKLNKMIVYIELTLFDTVEREAHAELVASGISLQLLHAVYYPKEKWNRFVRLDLKQTDVKALRCLVAKPMRLNLQSIVKTPIYLNERVFSFLT